MAALAVLAVSAATAQASPASFAPKVDYGTGGDAWAVAAADLNRDGSPDLVATRRNSASVAVLLGKGDGTFGVHTDFTVGDTPNHVTAADLNRDGKLDLAVADCGAGCLGAGSGKVSVLLGNGDGTFGAKTDFATDDGPVAVAVSDLNRDGKLDLATANRADTVSVLLGNGDGTFAAKTDVAGGGDLSFVAAADLNRDGKPDLAVANGVGMSVLLGNGDGTFGALTAAGTANLPLSVVAADLNRDGKADLAAPNFLDANSISVALGNGNGTFGPTKTYTIAGAGCAGGSHTTFCNPVSLAAGDLNADGRPDLVASAQGAGGVLVLLGTGNGAFGAPTKYAAGAYSVAIADLNRDGRPDLATSGGNVSVLLNRPPPTRTVLLSASRITWTAAGFVRVPIANPNPFGVIGRAKITTASPVALPGAGPGARKRIRTIAKDVFWIAARKSALLKLELTQVGRDLLAERRRRSVRVGFVTQGPTGAPIAASKVVPLEPAKPTP